MDLSLVIPTYNERENVSELVRSIFLEFEKNKIKGEIIIVDDNSPDKTFEIVKKLKEKYNSLNLIRRSGKLGLSSAVLEGFELAKSDVVGVMDADLSHPVDKISDMYNEIKKGNDLVIGSRYVRGGKILGWNFTRKILSRGATFLSRVFTEIKDPMTGYFLMRKNCIKNKNLNPRGFKILLEILIKGDFKKIKEIPITFTNRVKGKSKANFSEVFSLLNNLFGYFFYKKNVLEQFFKFAIVGIIGTVVNLLFLYIFTDLFEIYYLISAMFSFVISLTNNYILNKIWTFKEKIKSDFNKKYLKFALVSLCSLVVNLVFLYLFTEFIGIYYMLSQILAIGFAMIVNFLGNKIWTFS